jgi:hypothetical protein
VPECDDAGTYRESFFIPESVCKDGLMQGSTSQTFNTLNPTINTFNHKAIFQMARRVAVRISIDLTNQPLSNRNE